MKTHLFFKMPLHKPLLCRNVVRQSPRGGLNALFLAVSQTGEPENSWWARGGVPSTGGACGPGTALSLCPVDASPSRPPAPGPCPLSPPHLASPEGPRLQGSGGTGRGVAVDGLLLTPRSLGRDQWLISISPR